MTGIDRPKEAEMELKLDRNLGPDRARLKDFGFFLRQKMG